jgi:hypothetical protein
MTVDPPPDVAAQIRAVNAALDQVVPARTANNVLVGTWNVRAFDRIWPRWRSTRGASSLRDRSNVLTIAEIVRRFDVVAVQEVRARARRARSTLHQSADNSWPLVGCRVRGSLADDPASPRPRHQGSPPSGMHRPATCHPISQQQRSLSTRPAGTRRSASGAVQAHGPGTITQRSNRTLQRARGHAENSASAIPGGRHGRLPSPRPPRRRSGADQRCWPRWPHSGRAPRHSDSGGVSQPIQLPGRREPGRRPLRAGLELRGRVG